MPILAAAVLALIAVPAACSSSDGKEPAPDRAKTVAVWDDAAGWQMRPSAPSTAPEESWRVPARLDDDASYLVDGALVVVADRARGGGAVTVARVDPADGEELWTHDVDTPGAIDLQSDAAGSLVSVVTETDPDRSAVTVLDAETGAEIWAGAGDSSVSVESVDDPDLLLVSETVTTSAVDRATGKVRWTTDRFVTVSGGEILAEDIDTGGDGADGQNVAVLDAATGRARWDLERPLFADVAVVGETLILTEDRGGGADRATAYDAADGKKRWQAKLPRVGRASVQPIGDGVLITGAGESGEAGAYVVALAIDDGAEWWRTRASTVQSLLVDDELVGWTGSREDRNEN